MRVPSAAAAWASLGASILLFLGYLAYDQYEMRLLRSSIEYEMGEIKADVQKTLAEVLRAFEEERQRDAGWMVKDTNEIGQVLAATGKIEDASRALAANIATSQDDLNYRLGMHVEQHRRIEKLLERLEGLERDLRYGRMDRHPD